jgi:hypothetical protein
MFDLIAMLLGVTHNPHTKEEMDEAAKQGRDQADADAAKFRRNPMIFMFTLLPVPVPENYCQHLAKAYSIGYGNRLFEITEKWRQYN